MAISTFDMFTIGIGPSSSHTVGPMRAAYRFVNGLEGRELLDSAASVKVELYGSLGSTGRGHGSAEAVLLGLEGEQPELVDPRQVGERTAHIRMARRLRLGGKRDVRFVPDKDIVFFRRRALKSHPNGMRFSAFDSSGNLLRQRVYYSVGGGFVVDELAAEDDKIVPDMTPLPHPFTSGAELMSRASQSGLSIARLMLANEKVWRTEEEIYEKLDAIWSVMRESVVRGCDTEGILPGGLRVRRRAPELTRKLNADAGGDPLATMDWINVFALAVSEENAAGGRIVTAPTNGAAGIIPAVLTYYERFCPGADAIGTRRFLLAAAAIGIIFKTRASISGAEVGCQGEVGVACSMAAAGLCEALGGTPNQATCAAEIGMEHNLGLTCDPVGGLVQVPCIERNAMGAVKAVNAARLALRGDAHQKVSLDEVIETMRQTGEDMMTKYKETARGGLAVNIIEC
jgi:L-serine dehydratase